MSLGFQFSAFLGNTRLFGYQIQTKHILWNNCRLFITYHTKYYKQVLYMVLLFKVRYENSGNTVEPLINTSLRGYISVSLLWHLWETLHINSGWRMNVLFRWFCLQEVNIQHKLVRQKFHFIGSHLEILGV